jgi:hypothetical protein
MVPEPVPVPPVPGPEPLFIPEPLLFMPEPLFIPEPLFVPPVPVPLPPMLDPLPPVTPPAPPPAPPTDCAKAAPVDSARDIPRATAAALICFIFFSSWLHCPRQNERVRWRVPTEYKCFSDLTFNGSKLRPLRSKQGRAHDNLPVAATAIGPLPQHSVGQTRSPGRRVPTGTLTQRIAVTPIHAVARGGRPSAAIG